MKLTEPRRKSEKADARPAETLRVEVLDRKWVQVSWGGRVDLRPWHRTGNESHLVLDLADPEHGLLYEAVLPRPVDRWRLAVPRPGRYRVTLARRRDRVHREPIASSEDFLVPEEAPASDPSRTPAWMEEEATLHTPL
ncbi:MAG: hypothetical protein K6U79_00635 [Firmicutes bacterium]|nr:hypothetical protein [Bacillota bacterium]